jgi:hypothetical protein
MNWSISHPISFVKEPLRLGSHKWNSKWNNAYMKFLMSPNKLLSYGIMENINQEKCGLKIIVHKSPYYVHKSFGLRMLTEPLRNLLVVLNQLWKIAINWSNLVLKL